MEATPQQLDALFPHPGNVDIPNTAAKRVPGPVRQAGWTDESTQQARELLKDNHRRWHIFFNDKHFHNHASHHLLAIYAMGADSELLKAAYETHVVYQKPAFPPPEDKKIDTIIDDSNWKDHLGDERYYQAYLAFWTAKLVDKSISITSVLEKYVFSKDANVVPGKTKDAPMMLSRFLGGFLHPLIHCGYGVEFSLPGLIAEGIAQATGQRVEAAAAFPETLFEASKLTGLGSHLANLVISAKPAGSRLDALTILARVSHDPAFAADKIGLPAPDDADENSIGRVIRVAGKRLLTYAEEWTSILTGDHVTTEFLSGKYEEVVWMNTVIYATGGWAGRNQGEDKNKAFNADFFLMHLVTSAVFLPSFLNTLSPHSASVLLKTYFTISLVLYVARGRPALPISSFYANTSANPTPPTSSSASLPAKDTLTPHRAAPNPWLPIIQTTLVHPNEHLCKLQRALWHFADVYGGSPKGRFVDATEGGGAIGLGELDGTLFVRAAGLTADRMRWMKEGQEQGDWDRGGFFKKE
ncbi:hypothetical protein BDY19DRAFT_896974 [Irpex rosettiformis]|uniref:Uncharacterized protein n=1 Tax=Irpex rosettiformis TaxID=378272 RepID=A0ACB8TT96_9APHY|nr:hypothetical protein BDY19DRAFT_896974 [Irpex rosettiformis]